METHQHKHEDWRWYNKCIKGSESFPLFNRFQRQKPWLVFQCHKMSHPLLGKNAWHWLQTRKWTTSVLHFTGKKLLHGWGESIFILLVGKHWKGKQEAGFFFLWIHLVPLIQNVPIIIIKQVFFGHVTKDLVTFCMGEKKDRVGFVFTCMKDKVGFLEFKL